jgi:hypothetical protein
LRAAATAVVRRVWLVRRVRLVRLQLRARLGNADRGPDRHAGRDVELRLRLERSRRRRRLTIRRISHPGVATRGPSGR